MMNSLKKIWRGWIKFAEILGNMQMVVLLTIIYWTMLLVIAIPFKLFADPLSLKRTTSPYWIKRDNVNHDLDSLRRQG